MSESSREAVTRAITRMHADLGEPLTIDDLARTAMYSKFHFTRVFEKVTGVSPGRFLSAIRIDEAKRLLRETTLSVTEISHRVGWSSVGSFSSRFSASVGVSPSGYRRAEGFVPRPRAGGTTTRHLGVATSIRGNIRPADGDPPSYVFVGLFRERIPQGTPAACVLLQDTGGYLLSPVPIGSWYVLACGLPPDCETGEGVLVDGLDGVLVGASELVTVRPETTMINVDVDLHQAALHDPPMLLSLAHLTPEPMIAVAGSPTPTRHMPTQRPEYAATGAVLATAAVRTAHTVGGAHAARSSRRGRPAASHAVGVEVLSVSTMATPLALRR